ncbi:MULTISPECIES: ROK family transcriptional regulator [Mammaliicoccus]|jgi:predicted NBD/HSP70 family sugar kinase|uniref:ROK family transcriptional regulator n=2 Tax=Bacteria TaxID=2 RepID=A0ABS6GZ23_MAMLE|nr:MULTISPECIES: ROK family transcriptional regulator [Mammaliicoccus]MBF0748825.1 ROK family transcriptional regulator [Mammaliicoccus lentus]MBF0840735.1 ROK family transcriptional regulator [Mammaliicoccus lentus]MBU6114406.1 ROK family transcriptional regulator [Mammaliicoccus lentus]MBW0771088.1 ROK family transcriptional regulator [Mammaliicoccus lentus]TFU58430.1 ROK family transcriptional regulator [Mammaliicoccus lentus]
MENNLFLNINSNEKLVLKEIFNHQNISRTEISKNLGINKATISSILNKLKSKSLVREVGEGDSTKSGGRKPILLKVNHLYGYFISLDLTYSSVEVMYNYFDGNVIQHESYKLPNDNVSSILDILKEHVDVREKHDTIHGLLGMSVSIHGVVDNDQNVIYLPFHKTDGVSITEMLKEFAQVPVMIENEANLSALYERNFKHSLSINNLIALSIHKGIGAGLIINNKLYRGANGEAGEIGKTLVSKVSNNVETYHKIEDIFSQEALLQNLSHQLGETLTLSKLIQYYKERNSVVVQEMEQFINKIAILIHNLNTQFNPNAFYVNCPLINEMPEILEEIKEQFKQYSRNEIQIKLNSNVKYATLLGGTLAIIQKVLQIEDIQLDIHI